MGENITSILDSIKKMLGLGTDYTIFDADIIFHINTVLNNLIQIGVGPKEGFTITDKSTEWSSFINEPNIEQVKSYVYLKVRLLFDPPSNSSLIESIKNMANELEYRLYVQKGGY